MVRQLTSWEYTDMMLDYTNKKVSEQFNRDEMERISKLKEGDEVEELRKLARSKLQEAREEKDKGKRIQLLREARQNGLEAYALENLIKDI